MSDLSSVKILLAGVILISLGCLPLAGQNVETFKFSPELPDYKNSTDFHKLEYPLARVLQLYREKGLSAVEELAHRHHRVDLFKDRIRVVIRSLPEIPSSITSHPVNGAGEARDLSTRIQTLGGVVEVERGTIVQAQIPLDAVTALGNTRGIIRLRLPIKPHLHVVSEGVEFSGADDFEGVPGFQNYRTARIGILDIGFEGYENLLGSELPEEVTTRSFNWSGDLSGGGVRHGTACAEIVHDMSPDSQLFLANFDTLTEMGQAVEWFVDQGVNIISSSVGWYNAGAGDGTGPVCEWVDYALQNGVIWVNSAGNDADSHWEGQFVDSNHNGYCDFGGDDIFTFSMPAWYSLWVYLNWNDWGVWDGSDYSGSANDYDMYLYYYSGGWHYVDSSLYTQNGIRGQWPVESISGWYSSSTLTWGIKVKKNTGAAAKRLELFFDFNYSYNHEFINPWGSLAIPGDSPNAIAVGAIPWLSGYTDYYYTYSGRGPTSDNRVKPDLSAASSVTNDTYGTFGGTSASCPHVAGAFGVLFNRTPFSPDEIVELLLLRADDWGAGGKDNIFGEGKLDIDD
jgi:subtilisin family serine protease